MRSPASLLMALAPLIVIHPGEAAAQAVLRQLHEALSALVSPELSGANCTLVQGTLLLSGNATGCFTLTTGAVLDLNGFTLAGNVLSTSPAPTLTTSATLRNGTLTNGYVDFSLCESCVIDSVRVINGLPFPGFPNSSVVAGDDTQITRCFFSGNGDTVDLFFASAVITESIFKNNSLAVNVYASTAQISASTFDNNMLGVILSWTSNSEILSNHFRGNGVAVTISPPGGEPGPFFNTVSSNKFSDNGNGLSFLLGPCLPGGTPPSCMRGNEVSKNLFLLNHGSGLLFDTTRCGADPSCLNVTALIENNVFVANGINPSNSGDDNGLTVVGPPDVNNGVTIEENIAVANRDLGIDAPNVTDGGGNHASGNGNPLQCVGVVCTGPSCGLGFEVAPILPPLLWLRGRRRPKLV